MKARLIKLRKVVCRAKRKDTGEWVTGYYVYYYKHDSHIILFNYNACMNAGFRSRRTDFVLQDCDVDPETVCQYTEVDDKNGAKIFHKDIVSAPFVGYCRKKCTRIGVVEYVKGAFCVNWNDSEEYGKNFLGYVNDIEVIGNVFDNPELIGSD